MSKTIMGTISWKARPGIYLYGSQVDYGKDRVTYYNPLIASGKPIKTWYSKTNFQGNRIVPDLPLLIPGQSYQLVPYLETEPKDSLHVILYFFNRQGEQIDFIPLRDGQEEFTCPEETVTYQISLVTAGCQKVEFEKLELFHLDAQVPLNRPAKHKVTYDETLPVELELFSSMIEQQKDKL